MIQKIIKFVLQLSHVHYDMRKFHFSNRIISIWNSLPDYVDVDVERKQAQAIASLPDSITHYYAYSNEDFTVISLRLPVP